MLLDYSATHFTMRELIVYQLCKQRNRKTNRETKKQSCKAAEFFLRKVQLACEINKDT